MAGTIKAVLGPTNTGKTHYAVERMMGYASGMMGFPLRLLAREVYDRVVAVKGKNQVALLTGEEYIVPGGARYFLCTAEAMPRLKVVDFIGIDEIQMAADPQRGHIFTEHLLHSRGQHETLLMGAETMGPLIRRLIPEAEIVRRERFSTLKHIEPLKLSRLPRRSAVVGFSANDVYAMAELMRRQKGGAAIVMGALSPRTRNAQVELYQSGDVDHLVATDAIGMGLNMDIGHVSFASTSKFDGLKFRDLRASEAAQIAGRAGRYKKDGTFTTLGGETAALDPRMIAQIEDHQFEPVKTLYWRNHRLDFSSIPRLLRSLDMPAVTDGLHRVRGALDREALQALSHDDAVTGRTNDKATVERLWNVCQIPDFRKLSHEDHFNVLRRIFGHLSSDNGVIAPDWIAGQVKRLDNIDGDIDTLAARIASIRVWTYVSQRKSWLEDQAHWAHVTRSVEDKLSDALHEKLTQRFVDRRTAVLMRSLRQRGKLSVSIDEETNQVSVEGHEIGELLGFSFKVEPGAVADDQKTLKAAAESALQAELTRKAKLFANVGFKTLGFDFSSGLTAPKLVWDGAPIATVHHVGAFLAPRVKLLSNNLLSSEMADLVQTKAQDWLDERIAEKLEPLVRLARELNGEVEPPEGTVPLSGAVRGVAFRLMENMGILARSEVAGDLRQIDQEERKGLRRFGIRIGATSLYMPLLLKPHACELRLMMWALSEDRGELPELPTPGMVWVDPAAGAPKAFYEMAGFQMTDRKAVRVDMLERLADAVRPLGQNREWFEVTPEIMGLVGLSGEDFAAVMKSIGYKNEVRQVENKPSVAVSAEDDEKAVTEATVAPVSDGESVDGAAEAEAIAVATADAQTTGQNAEVLSADAAESQDANDGETKNEAPELVDRFFFMWAPQRSGGRNFKGRGRQDRDQNDAQRDNRGKGRKPNARGGKKPSGPRVHQSGPQRKPKQVDPDSPFAALAGLKESLSSKK